MTARRLSHFIIEVRRGGKGSDYKTKPAAGAAGSEYEMEQTIFQVALVRPKGYLKAKLHRSSNTNCN
ncbi:hypothetical protein EIKCOROL_01259 [Eikenella corrodens ATCC 23834]|uniref:Uncharacterized protein n=1 Tax=Eikenella corrodens ATCC 23834 TaxID=546274 RepID=C0DV71_EIKCO|nr:hypothetical protein EIKCOROL_01259 [Eikenella corrodens ATCC 23834]